MNNTYYGTLIFELSKPGRKGYSLPKNELSDYSIAQLPENLLRQEAPALPEVDELTVVRHYTNMSNNNFGVDTGFYPLGSCTMKYNPKINEEMAAHPQFTALHPLRMWKPCKALCPLTISSNAACQKSLVWLSSRSIHSLAHTVNSPA